MTVLVAALLLMSACSDDTQKPVETNSRIAESPDELIELLATAYREQDSTC